MYSVSSGFKNAADDNQRIPAKRFTFIEDVDDWTENLLDMGSLSQQQYEGEELTGSDISVELTNDAKEFNFLLANKDNIGEIGKLELGFDGEYIDRYRGHLEDFELFIDDRAKCRMRFSSKAQKAIETGLGSNAFPLDYSASAYNPADLAWELLTVRAGLDDTTSTANVDIDYTSWLAYQSICQDLTFSLRGYFTGQSVAEALRLISQLTDALIFGETDGKIYFRKFIPEESSSPYLFTDANAHIQAARVEVNKKRLLNKAKVWYGYDPVLQAWDGSVTEENTEFPVTIFREFDNAGVWHDTEGSAQAFAERLVYRYKEPPETIHFSTKQGTQALIHQKGDMIEVTCDRFDYAAKLMRLYGISGGLTGGEYQLVAEDMTLLNQEFFILDSATNGVLDQNVLF